MKGDIIEENEMSEIKTDNNENNESKNLLNNYILNNNNLLGKGSFGSIYTGVNKETGEEVAIKVEKKEEDEVSQLKIEYKAYKILEGGYGIPKIFQFIENKHNNILIMEKLGPSLEKLFNKNNKRFNLLGKIPFHIIPISHYHFTFPFHIPISHFPFHIMIFYNFFYTFYIIFM